MSRKTWRWLLLAVLVCTFAGLKLAHEPSNKRADGFYYMHIATQLAEGHGYTSRVSMYLQGFSYFPHPVNQSPGWILVLAGSSLVLGMENAARYVPEFFYLLDLVLLYLLAIRIRERIAGGRGGPAVGEGGPGWLGGRWPIDFGHVALVLLAANPIFFRFTSSSYSEAQAFALMLGAFLALDRAALGRSFGWAAASGLLAGLAVLTRAHALPLLIGLPGVLALVGLRDRRFLGLAGVLLAAAAVPWVPWVAWLSTWVDPLTAQAILGLATLPGEIPFIDPQAHAVQVDGLGAYLRDRAQGFWYAFHPRHRFSYTSHWGAVVWVVLIAPVWFVLRGLPRPPVWLRGPAPERVVTWAVLACGIGMLIPVHMQHGAFFKAWLFGHRHGLPLLFVLLPCLAWLDARSLPARSVAALLLAASFVFMSGKLVDSVQRTAWGYPASEYELGAWLDAHEEPPVVVSSRAQRLANRTKRTYFHWVACQGESEPMLAMLRKGIADYAVMFFNQEGCKWARFETRKQRLRLLRKFGKGEDAIHVYTLRELGPQPAAAKPPG